ncbi:alpha-2-macroglobulin family protein [Mucilaginibacter antarcticus]|uniref:alpha-2-macroglobulin family protein n=1 Tax=Mucilaginibacter antarcticus TaxID=1855725 RepID=UPI0036306BA2
MILPDSGKLMMPFEAINLNAVDVTIIKIYENNVPQYFQNNGFNGQEQLRQLGKPIIEKTIRLDNDKSINLSKKNRFMLDIDHLIRTEPGAIYRVLIGFRRSYSLFNCSTQKVADKTDGDSSVEEGDNEEGGDYNEEGNGLWKAGIDEDDDFWSRYDNYYPQGYKWNEREDPCTDSYYSRDRWATRNIIASNIGLIVKRGNDNSMLVAVTSIMDAGPLKGVELELLDYQKQIIQKVTSDDDGFATFTLKRRPYLLIAKKGSERGYLKLDDGSSLPLSRFDVGGETVQKGLKGFIYGERGVWRPGDSIFVSFILEDKLKSLPPDHPVDFELYNPQGQVYKKITSTHPVDGFYRFSTATTLSSPTGNWMAKVKVGGVTFEKPIKIETIMPNRLKLSLSFGNRESLTKGNSDGVLNARWLFGGIAQNLKAKVDAFMSSQNTAFKGFEGYTFDDPTLKFGTQTQNVFDGRLDENGNAKVNADINLEKQAPGQLRANFVVKVFEPGGNFSINQVSLPYNVYPGYVGIKVPEGKQMSGMLTTDDTHNIDLADVNVNGQLFAGTRDVEVQLYKIQWRWWWDQSGDEMSNFTQDQLNKLIRTDRVQLVNGRGKWGLRIPKEDWGRYLIKVKDNATGHSTGKIVYVDWPNWAERLQQDNATEAAMLSFTSDKKNYKVGEQATLTIPTGSNGRALVSFENGSKVIKSLWIDTRKGETRYTFKVEPGMAPNVFVNVTLLQHYSQTANDLPIRMYGAIPIKVDDPETVLKPIITMPDKIRPQTPSSITVSETSGKEMTYTVALVDEGILDLTNFKTPDPHSVFYAREALGVKTWDLFDYIIGAYGGGLERILSIGGDQGLLNNQNATINRFKPVVKFMGPFHLAKGDKQTHKFTLPQYIGSVRAMVVAGHGGAYGQAEKAGAVKKPLMVLSTLPRVLGPGEKFQLPVTVFAMESNIKNVNVQIQTTAFTSTTGMQKTISFAKPGDQVVTFDMDVKNFVGVAKVRIIAKSGGETAVEDVELSVRTPNPPITRTIEKELQPGQSWTGAYAAIGMPGTNSATLEVSAIPPLNLADRLSYLMHYPYGCVEQTTSSGFPQLYLDQLLSLSPKQKAEVQQNVKATISRLNGFQIPSGGLSYWPGEGNADDWGTNYAGHFMLAAKAKGYNLPVGFLDAWKRYQKQKALNWSPKPAAYFNEDMTQAYRLYLLAMAGAPELGAMNRLKETPTLTSGARWQLAAAYKLTGQPEVGLQMIRGLSMMVGPYKQLYGTYGSDLRDEAITLQTLILLGQQQKASVMMQKVASSLSQDDWYSTQTTAYALMAIAQYCGQNQSGNKLLFNYQSGTSKGNITSTANIWQGNLAANGGQAYLKNNGKNRLYIRLIQKGQPAPGQEQVAQNKPEVLQMQVTYYGMTGKPVNVASIKQGTDFVAQVTIKNPGARGRYDNVALTQMFPSGWEILNTRMLNNDEVFKSSPSDYRDIRDDRVYTYFGLNPHESATYTVMLTAAYAGKYYLPGTYCEAMYDASINYFEKGQWVEVVK